MTDARLSPGGPVVRDATYYGTGQFACAAEQLGYAKTQINDWLWRLREVGMRHLFGASPEE